MIADFVRESMLAFLSEEVMCTDVDSLVACNMIITYPDGDSVVVYVEQRGNEFKVTDCGEGYRNAIDRPNVQKGRIRDEAATLCSEQGVLFVDGVVFAMSDRGWLADTAWRVALASMQISHTTRHRSQDLFVYRSIHWRSHGPTRAT